MLCPIEKAVEKGRVKSLKASRVFVKRLRKLRKDKQAKSFSLPLARDVVSEEKQVGCDRKQGMQIWAGMKRRRKKGTKSFAEKKEKVPMLQESKFWGSLGR